MSKYNVVEFTSRDTIDPLNELLQAGVRQLLAGAVKVELQAFLDPYSGQVTETGHAVVIRNGYHPELT